MIEKYGVGILYYLLYVCAIYFGWSRRDQLKWGVKFITSSTIAIFMYARDVDLLLKITLDIVAKIHVGHDIGDMYLRHRGDRMSLAAACGEG